LSTDGRELGLSEEEDFSDLVGTWAPDQTFDDVIVVQGQVDPEIWK
jgi:hypothetical protein